MQNNIVTCDFLGRLANNAFQVAACMRYGQMYDVPWAVLPHYHHRQIYQYFKSPVFRGNHKKLTLFDRTHNDEEWGYCDFPNLGKSVKLRGFFQSYRYLDPVKDQFIKWLNFKKYPDLHDFTSIHIRRTDYIKYADNFGPVSLDYVRKAMDMVSEIKGSYPEKFLVFSDDVAWCKTAFAEYFPDQVFIFSPGLKEQPNGGKNEYEQLSLMSSCLNNIIANSSFSYVAAYANQNPDKVVITPSAKDWFGPSSKLNTKDLLPIEWNQIDWR